jgi:hypothetical protein
VGGRPPRHCPRYGGVRITTGSCEVLKPATDHQVNNAERGARALCDIAHRSSNGRIARRRGIPVARAGPRPGWPAGRPALDTRLLTIALALVAARRRAIGMATKGSPAPSANGAAKHDRVLGSPHGRLTGPKSGPRRGYRVPHARAMTGVGAPYTPRTAVLIPVWGRAQPAPAALRRLVLQPRSNIHLAGLRFTRHQRGFTQFTRPDIPLACGRPDGTGRRLSFPLRLPHPADQESTTHAKGRDRPSSTDLEQRFTTSAEPPILRVHSLRATSRRTVQRWHEQATWRPVKAAGPPRRNDVS